MNQAEAISHPFTIELQGCTQFGAFWLVACPLIDARYRDGSPSPLSDGFEHVRLLRFWLVLPLFPLYSWSLVVASGLFTNTS